jgi:anoctamin-8
MVMQFGLMVFFAPAFPLAALFSLINNVIEIRSDAFKMCYLFQRPFGQRVSNIGTWQVRNLLELQVLLFFGSQLRFNRLNFIVRIF